MKGQKKEQKFYEIVGGEKNALNIKEDYQVSLDLLKNGDNKINDDLNKVRLVRLFGSLKQAGAVTALASVFTNTKTNDSFNKRSISKPNCISKNI